MTKSFFNRSWLFLVIPVGFILFVIAPEIQKKYNDYKEHQIALRNNIYILDSLKQLKKTNTKDNHLIKKLEITIPIHTRVYRRQKFLYYKTGGLLIILILMGIYIIGLCHSSNKKKATKSKRINFNFENPEKDRIAQQISWNSLESSSSNFKSEILKKTKNGYQIMASPVIKVFAWSFFLIGGNYLLFSIVQHYESLCSSFSFIQIGKLFFTSGGPFLLTGIFLIALSLPKVYINTFKKDITFFNKKILFQEIYALQIIEKFSKSKRSSNSYPSFELNIITKNGNRYNLLNHGDKTHLLSDMVKISKVLRVPIWNKIIS
ncbi:hypothetical protein [Tenacibaculum maritimum]|uniref:hypothetical protein n=1 Tax=Tenacibaculum maritimum TaxID=107401 RepID=UPI0012E44ABA|nr:hypothetical protein [Tenacibaculum maritimum]CAA0152237.1 membrane hypothetical protein [Tenacibaculum maritimum]